MNCLRSLVLATLALLLGRAGATEEARFFQEQVAPVLEQRCFECHSHRAGKMKGGLTLDSRSGWAEGGDSGPAIVPGEPGKSLLLSAVNHADADLKMPKEKLPAAEIAVLSEWVKRGAFDPRETTPAKGVPDEWWSLRPLVRPPVPPGAAHPIDAFIHAKLQAHRLTPSPPADGRTLLRRLSLDLHGLPPTPEEVDAFVHESHLPQSSHPSHGTKATDTTDGPYERLVDRLLASPRYGERWARHWLDVIHFADTHGFEHDVFRKHAWRYRDYVIASLNADTPWPRFIREQLAADRFFPDEPRLTVALGFLGAGTYDSSAAGTAPQSFEYLDRDDLVTQTMASFASATVHCARCHAHKFDPIPQEDYFALQAVFAGVGKGDITFDEDAAIARQRRRWKTLLTASAPAQESVLLAAENEALVRESEAARGAGPTWESLEIEVFISSGGAVLQRNGDGSISASGPRPDKETSTITAASRLPEITALRLELLPDDALPQKGPGRNDNGNLHLTEFEAQLFRPGAGAPEKLKFLRASADWNQAEFAVAKAIDGDAKTSWAIFPKVGEPHHAVFVLEQKRVLEPGSKLAIILQQIHGGAHLIGRFRLSATSSPAAIVDALPAAAETALAVPSSERTREQRVALAAAVLQVRASEELAHLPAQVKVFAAASSATNERGMITMAEPRVIRVLKRGDLDKPGAEAVPGALSAVDALPARFAQLAPKDEAARRAALADWLADPQNPLTWRSIANRVWQTHFGRGLCDTPNDFGRMGGNPSHPELLDWLAAELRESGGSLKHLHRLICTSATYQQRSSAEVSREQSAVSSEATHGSLLTAHGSLLTSTPDARDPNNRLLWRMNRPRLDAETFRDSVLAISGRLELTMGGPAVEHFKTSPGPQATPSVDYSAFDWDKPGAARRSIYRAVWRGIPDPFMDALDFPDAAMLSPVRGFSASPLQSLALLNNDFVVHHARQLAGRLEKEAGCSEQQIRAAFRVVLLRAPTAEECGDFTAYAEKHTLAAACRLLLNSNEFLFVN